MAKHTDGPWEFHNSSGQIVRPTGADDWMLLAEVHLRAVGEEQFNANGLAMAAAPEILKALKYARRFLKAEDVDIAYIDSIIAKAEG